MHTLTRPRCRVRRPRPVRLPVVVEGEPAPVWVEVAVIAGGVLMLGLVAGVLVLAGVGARAVYGWLMN